MTVREVKEYLKQYEDAERIARRLKSEYDAALLRIDAIKSPMDTDGLPHGSNITRRTEETAIQLAEAAKRYKDAEVEAIKKRGQVFNVIWNVPGIKGDILYERYINLKRWEEIADIVHVSFRHATRLHGEVLKELKDVLECPIMS